ncbi:MAG: hypothetical protein R3F11_05665 [Verrucomicrobiales bacterium]
MRLTPAALICALAFGAAAAAQPPPRPSLVPGTGAEPVPYSPGWDSEALSDAAGGQMKALVKRLTDPEAEISAAALAEICAPDFACSALRPRTLPRAFGGPAFAVRRAFGGLEGGAGSARRSGAGKVGARLAEGAGRRRASLFGQSGRGARRLHPRHRAALRRRRASRYRRWVAEWTGSEPPLLGSLPSMKRRRGKARRNTNATAAAIGGTDAFREQLQFGIHHWLARIEMAWGIDVGGWRDVSDRGREWRRLGRCLCAAARRLAQPPLAPKPRRHLPRLLHPESDRLGGCDHAAVFADFDNDGDADCAVAMLYSTAHFRRTTGQAFRCAALRCPTRSGVFAGGRV